jgi:hypothetical protein
MSEDTDYSPYDSLEAFRISLISCGLAGLSIAVIGYYSRGLPLSPPRVGSR